MAATVTLADGIEDAQLAQGFSRLASFAVGELPDGRGGRALEHLLGIEPAAYGESLSVRRGLAARALHIKVDTFRRNYEEELLADLADQIWLIELGVRRHPDR